MRKIVLCFVTWLLTMGFVAADGLAERIRAASAGGSTWVGWTVPSATRASICCSASHRGDWAGGRCSLKDDESSWYFDDDDDDSAPGSSTRGTVRLWLRAEAGVIDRVKMVSLDCDVDTAGVRTARLDQVDPRESVALLDGLVTGPGAKRLREDALAGIALHGTPVADTLLERHLAEGSRKLQSKAAFWLATARGERGAKAVMDRFEQEDDADMRQELIFPLYVAERESTERLLVRAARRDPAASVRKQALFWIAQRAGERATAMLEQAIAEDPQSEVRQHAVFAVSQLPADRAVPLLIDLAETHHDPEVRRQAIFWLGQLQDPRATEYLISLID